MSRAAGWYVDPDGEPAMRYWDGDDWTSRTRPISSEDLPPLDFLLDSEQFPPADFPPVDFAPADPAAVPAPTVPGVVVAPLPPPDDHLEVPASARTTSAPKSTKHGLVVAAGSDSDPVRRPRPFALLAAFFLFLPVALVCLLPAAWAVRRFSGWPGWTAFAAWAATAVVLLIPPARQALARMAPTRPADPSDPATPNEHLHLDLHEPSAQLAALSWLVAPLLLAHWIVRWSTKAIDRLWLFLQHLAESGKNRRTTASTVAVVVGIVRATLFWLLWSAAGLLRMLLHSLRIGADSLLRAAAVLGDRVRSARD